MIKKVAFTVYPVVDMVRARKFYEETLGFAVGSHSDAWAEYDLPGGGCFGITTLMEGMTPSVVSGGVVAFEVDGLQELVESLRSKGVTVRMEVVETPVCHMAVLVDSEGNPFLLHQIKPKA
jgi:predicted enzyme related to lactoylglutathione lyase